MYSSTEMTSFGWKRKTGANVIKSATTAFQQDAGDSEDEDIASGRVDWLCFASNKRPMVLEDALGKSNRLKEEGERLAEAERYWEAIRKWDAALQLNPDNYCIMEMKAQAYMTLNELYPALQAAEKSTELNPLWWVGYQTLGRAQLGLGEVRLAIKSFSRAVHLNPDSEELWQEDLMWAVNLLKKKDLVKEQTLRALKTKSVCKITEIADDTASDETGTIQTVTKIGTSQGDIEVVQDKCSGSEEPMMKNRETVPFTSCSTRTLKQLPNNYVCMRD